ncbi:MAG: hypothetical protein HY960_14240 [Ignavibacteriae bacterium]|nr:hypothetical protein [Ignavibacteriota bacterium]
MANTNAQVEAEKWIRENELPRIYGQTFRQRNLCLKSKGEFKFDAVSDDGKIVVVISTSSAENKNGKTGTGKLLKIRADAYWFMNLAEKPDKCVFVFSEDSMIELLNEERKKGRFPQEFEIIKVVLPPELEDKVKESRKIASEEVRPRN